MRRLFLMLLALAPWGASAQSSPTSPQGGYLEGMGRTPEDEALLQQLSNALKAYEEEAREYRREAKRLIEHRYEERRGELASSYEKTLSALEAIERQERLTAIGQFEGFLQRYPREPRHTPDVMFRLAELYYERSSDEHLAALNAHEAKLQALPESETPPPEPSVNFGLSIALYQRLIQEFPDYRLNDGAWYLLGYCLEKQNQFDESHATYQQLIARYPKSRFAIEAWVRIGEHYFDSYSDAEALAKAAQAYEAATRDPSHPLYDKALYKLGWAYYRMDRFDESVDRFLDLADFYETQKQTLGEGFGGGDLREEALQYVAISLADETWGGLAKTRAVIAQRGGSPPYEADLYRRLGNVWFDQTNHTDAITAYRHVLQKDPLAPDAPRIQQKIVEAYERDRKLPESFAEASLLARLYSPGSAWYKANESSPQALATANAMAEKSLYSAATYHHQQALTFKKEGKFEQARTGFEEASRSYGAYLERFSRSPNAYEMRFYYAECLYNSFQFPQAAKNYEEVRDWPKDTRFLKDAAFSAVLAWQQQLALDIKAGKAKEHKALRSSELTEGQTIQAIPLSESETRLVASADGYVDKLPQDDKSPGIAYKAAELFYAHNDFPEARRRLEAIVQKWPKNEVAGFSTNLIVESFLIDKDWRSVEEVSGRLIANKDVIDPSSELYKELVKYKLSGRFKLADQLLAAGQYDEAAKKYLLLVEEAPRHEFADKALNNAAIAYENTRRFDSALKLYERIYREYPNSKLADAALFRVAVNAEKSYDFDKAVVNYQKLVKDYPTSQEREAALYNAARLMEAQQRYPEAAKAFVHLAEQYPKAEDAPKHQYRAALIYEKNQDWWRTIRELNTFVSAFAKKPAQGELVVEAKKRIGDAFLKLNDERNAERAWTVAASEFTKRGMKPDTHPRAAEAAASSRFQLAELEFQKFDKLKIGGRGSALKRSFEAKRDGVKAINSAYDKVFPYKRLEWSLAASYRKGYALERFANTIIETPVPADVKSLGEEAVVAYQEELAKQTTAFEDSAVEKYMATLQEVRKSRVANEWSRRILESLNRFRPKEYPVLKEPKQSIASATAYPEGLVGSLSGSPPPSEEPAQKLSAGGEK
ncbi:tetratricopeptide repeat protein [Stigmatella aurantiaca]|uniref:Tetratricopeptide repeat protein n=2 Tax=Stigmatella aurantiaca (strain DW4/3-1) TaxID=378806 RepID=E3FKX2_STIAD|nr:tetratricopeptide repeat protein [Stigmatella aurantiaca]ADO70490.1 Tetratricopeptide repeat protein [Stigmatella aurantiaca DW4/3-1]